MTTPLVLAQMPITETLEQQISKVIDAQKRSRPYGDLFARPVDYKALGIPDYPEVIKTPMDFSTLQKKLMGKQYFNISEFLQDASLIFENCRVYNGQAENGYYQEASGQQELNLIGALSKIIPDLTEEAYKQILALGDVVTEGNPEPFEQGSDPKVEDIQQLVRKLSELPETVLGEALKIYMDAKGLELARLGDEELDIKLSTTDGPLLWKMMSFCEQKLDELKKSKKKFKK